MTLNYSQIEDFMTVYLEFDELNDSNIISHMKNLPKEWSEYIINNKLSKVIRQNDKESIKSLTERCVGISNQLGIDIEEKMITIMENQDKFYISDVVYLQSAMDILEKFNGNKIHNDIFDSMSPVSILYLKEIALGKENYEILQILKEKKLI